jgi:hypothetical protein
MAQLGQLGPDHELMTLPYGDRVPKPVLMTTTQVARQLGISARTLVRYAQRGYVTPAVVLPSGHRRWRLAEVREQCAALQGRDSDG